MANRIRQLMDERGLKPTPFAREIGVKTSTMFSIYRGNVEMGRISADNFMRIARGLGMTADELIFGGQDEREGTDSREDALLDAFRCSNENGKVAILAAAMAIAEEFADEE